MHDTLNITLSVLMTLLKIIMLQNNILHVTVVVEGYTANVFEIKKMCTYLVT